MSKILSLALLSIFLFLLFLSPLLIVFFPTATIPLINIHPFLFFITVVLVGWILFATSVPIIRFHLAYAKATSFIKSNMDPNEKIVESVRVYFSLLNPDGKAANSKERDLYQTNVKDLFWNGPKFGGLYITDKRFLLIANKPDRKNLEILLDLNRDEIKKIKIDNTPVETSEYTVSRLHEILHLLFFFLLLRVYVPTGGKPSISGLKITIETPKGAYNLELAPYTILGLAKSEQDNAEKLRVRLELLLKTELQ